MPNTGLPMGIARSTAFATDSHDKSDPWQGGPRSAPKENLRRRVLPLSNMILQFDRTSAERFCAT